MEKFGKPKLSEEEKKAREEKKAQEQAKKAAEKKEQEKNRKINFFIMRYMWQAIRGRNADESIYLAFNMSRERYTRVIETGTVRYGKKELDFLKAKTGIPKEIFTGEKRFAFPNKKGEEMISDVDWDKLFNLRDKRKKKRASLADGTSRNGQIVEKDKVDYKNASEQYKEIKTGIEKILREYPREGEMPFHRLCSFLKNGYGSRLETLQEIGQALAHINVALLDECTKVELENLSRVLAKSEQIVTAVLTYRNLKNDFQK